MTSSYRSLWEHELNAYLLYRSLAQIERGNSKGNLFIKLSLESLAQAAVWQEKAQASDIDYKPGLKLKLVLVMLPLLGPRRILDVLSSLKIRGLSVYRVSEQHSVDENIHASMKRGTSLRAALFGINDGLVSNASLVFAMVGAQAQSQTLLLAGGAGLLAGAFSMAVGEYVSVKSQAELYELQIALERAELEAFPLDEAKELSLIYQAKGVSVTLADDLSLALVKDPVRALDTLAREELGLNPDELGSGLSAALTSFVSFAIGAAIPLIPFVLLTPSHALMVSLLISFSALFIIGAATSLFTGKSALMSGMRMAFLGLAAGTATYFIGRLIGV